MVNLNCRLYCWLLLLLNGNRDIKLLELKAIFKFNYKLKLKVYSKNYVLQNWHSIMFNHLLIKNSIVNQYNLILV